MNLDGAFSVSYLKTLVLHPKATCFLVDVHRPVQVKCSLDKLADNSFNLGKHLWMSSLDISSCVRPVPQCIAMLPT